MLEFQEAEEPNKVSQTQFSADHERVTAEEFSAAITAVEKRKSAEAEHLAGTVEIGATCRELGIEASPEDIYREVESQRALKNPPPVQEPPVEQKPSKSQMLEERELAAAEAKARLMSAAAEAVKGLTAAAVVAKSHLEEAAVDYRQKSATGNQTSAFRQQRAAQRDVMRAQRHAMRIARRSQYRKSGGGLGGIVILGAFFWVFYNTIGFPHHLLPISVTANNRSIHALVGNQSVDVGPAGVFVQPVQPIENQTIGGLQDGQIAYVTTDTFRQILAQGGVLGQSDENLLTSTTVASNPWPIQKYKGRLYIRGYTTKQDQNSFEHRPQTLYSALPFDANQDQMMSVVVPLAGAEFGASKDQSSFSSIQMEKFKADDFTQRGD